MKRSTTIAVACALAVPACFQKLDDQAAAGGDDETSLATPPIDLPNGDTTTNPCDRTHAQATATLRTYCADCHGGDKPGARRGQPPFDFVLDLKRLTHARSESVRDPHDPSKGMVFIVPGDPASSRVYRRIADDEMPPTLPVGLDPLPRPTISDVSVLYTWITSCITASDD
jgi:hypothetical protein